MLLINDRVFTHSVQVEDKIDTKNHEDTMQKNNQLNSILIMTSATKKTYQIDSIIKKKAIKSISTERFVSQH